MSEAMTIGQLAKATGVAARTIRYYEAVGVLSAPPRSAAGYREYDDRHVQGLLFVRRARALGLPLRDVQALRASVGAGVNGAMRPKLLASLRAQLAAVRRQIRELDGLRRQLEQVLRRAPSAASRSGACRCLEGGGRAEGRPVARVAALSMPRRRPE